MLYPTSFENKLGFDYDQGTAERLTACRPLGKILFRLFLSLSDQKRDFFKNYS